jgi:DNA-directed RNA polymerase subunit RPC12/RpoP
MVDLIRIAPRVYKCCGCGNEITTDTNHREAIYPRCRGKCRNIVNPHTSRETVMPAYTKHEFVKDADK